MTELRMQMRGLQRRALLFVPPGYQADAGLPLIVVPQAFGWSAEFNIQHSKLVPLAIARNFSLLQLDAPDLAMNVALDGRANPARPDDVAYTSAVLIEVDRVLCLDARRIYCVGFSRGARFCSRLASERSDIFAAITALSGLRYPRPNNASRPVPILTFHGTADAVNPYPGGGPPYWQSSVTDAVAGWVDFNDCSWKSTRQVGTTQLVLTYGGCRNDAEVIFTTTDGGGHEWPDALYPVSAYPHEAPQANNIILDFLMDHPLPVTLDQRQPVEVETEGATEEAAVKVAPQHRPHGVGENIHPAASPTALYTPDSVKTQPHITAEEGAGDEKASTYTLAAGLADVAIKNFRNVVDDQGHPAGAPARDTIRDWEEVARVPRRPVAAEQVWPLRRALLPVVASAVLVAGLLVARVVAWRMEARLPGRGRSEASQTRTVAAAGGGVGSARAGAEFSHLLC